MVLKIVLITFFSLFLLPLTGCITFGDKPNKVEWNYPEKPVTKKIEFKKIEGGFLITEKDAKQLADNVDELKAYNKKLEALVKKMEKHYGK
jgi:hypothetical protein